MGIQQSKRNINHFDIIGKCDTCHEDKTLDSMVRKDYVKGLYECIDCKTHKESQPYDRTSIFYQIGITNHQTRIQRILQWLTG